MANPLEQIKQGLDLEAARGVPSNIRAAIGNAALGSQKVVLSDPVYSMVSFEFVRAAGPPVLFTLNQGFQAIAFGYGLNDAPTAGGFRQTAAGAAYEKATLEMTNIREKGKPNAGETHLVYGISLLPTEDSEPELAALIASNVSVLRVQNGGKQRNEIGRISFAPGNGGLTGRSKSLVATPPINDSQRVHAGFFSNGLPGRENMLLFAEPWYWRPAGSTDSDLQIVFTVERNLSFTSTARAADVANGIAAFTPPAATSDPGTYVRLSVLLHSYQSSSRSDNM